MERKISLGVFFIALFALSLTAVALGWTVKGALSRAPEDRTPTQHWALRVASYPDTAIEALREVTSYGTGDYKDMFIRVTREPDADYSGFVAMPAEPDIDVSGLLMKADPASMRPGWRLAAGAFTIGEEPVNAALLISPENRIVNLWKLTEPTREDIEPQPQYRKLVHGIEPLPDGSLIFAFDNGRSLQRIDRCGRRIWSRGGIFHHTVTLDERRETLWTLSGIEQFVNLDAASGEVLRSLETEDIIDANPGIDILELRRNHAAALGTNLRNTKGEWLRDSNGVWGEIVLHFNDVDPLPARIADRFPMAEAGNLLISARSLNLVFILDPDTLRIKWWRVGGGQRQHDPDWQPDGRITIFDNRMSRDYSQIVALDPITFEREILFDGRRNDFYTRIRGKHQVLDDGTLVVSSPQQGRAFEVAPDGEVVFELVNTKPDSAAFNYTISEMRWLPPEFFDVEDWTCE